MIEKLKNEAENRKEYVSVWMEIRFLDAKDVVTASIGDHDVNQDDIFDE